jgi:hypothetical protein
MRTQSHSKGPRGLRAAIVHLALALAALLTGCTAEEPGELSPESEQVDPLAQQFGGCVFSLCNRTHSVCRESTTSLSGYTCECRDGYSGTLCQVAPGAAPGPRPASPYTYHTCHETPQCGQGDFCAFGATCSRPCQTSEDCPAAPNGRRPICSNVQSREFGKALGCVMTCVTNADCNTSQTGAVCGNGICYGCGGPTGSCL